MMAKFKKLLPYLFINVVVSAVTMIAVILIWNALHPSPVVKNYPGLTTSSTAESAEPTLPPLDQKSIEIQSVFLPGEMNYEKVTLKNVAKVPVDLTGWKLQNEQDQGYIFPALSVYPNGAVDVYTKAGANTAVELFANQEDALWKSGKNVLLFDSAGQERSRYKVP